MSCVCFCGAHLVGCDLGPPSVDPTEEKLYLEQGSHVQNSPGASELPKRVRRARSEARRRGGAWGSLRSRPALGRRTLLGSPDLGAGRVNAILMRPQPPKFHERPQIYIFM